MKDFMVEAQKYCEDQKRPRDPDLIDAFIAGANFGGGRKTFNGPYDLTFTGEINITYKTGNIEMEFDDDMDPKELSKILNTLIKILDGSR